MKRKLLDEAIRIARRNMLKHPEYDNKGFLHWSFIIKDNKIVSIGMNNVAVPLVKWGYCPRKKGNETFPLKTHSEFNAISRSREYIRGATMINVRLTKTQETRLSLPCLICRNVLNVVGIKKVWFTLENESWGNYDY